MRYFIHLAYKGTRYRGWQTQNDLRTVQFVLEKYLSQLLRQTTKVHPCGRTDAGVHARQFFAHFDSPEAIEYDFVFRMNKLLPHDIAVYDLIEVPPRANAQLDAFLRTYYYYLHQEKNPFLEEGSAWYSLDLDIEKMKVALPLFLGKKDFTAMCLTPAAHSSTICDVTAINIKTQAEDTRMRIEITANRFLRGMVRLTVARLIDIGIGKITIEELRTALKNKERVPFHTSAHPQGLYLAKVRYPFLDIPSKELFLDKW